MKNLLWATGYSLLDLLKYYSFFIIVFNFPIYKKKITIPVLLLFSVLCSLACFLVCGDEQIFGGIPNYCAFFIVVVIEKGKRLKGFLCMAVTWIVMDSLSGLVRVAFYALLGEERYLRGALVGRPLWDKALVLMIPLIYYFIVNIFVKKKIDYSLSFFQLGIVFSSFLGELFIIYALGKVLRKRAFDQEAYIITAFATTALLLLFIIVMVWQSFVVKKNNEMKQDEIKYQYMLKAQADYFEGLKKNEEKVRIFRHDVRAHITAIQKHLDEGNVEKLREYLACIQKQVDTDESKKYTCNIAVDAVINDQVKAMNKKNIKFQYDGCPKIREDISDYDLCTIFYNILKNAVEGCEKIEDDEKCISVNVLNNGEQLVVKIENDTILKDKTLYEEMFTTKKDIKNHGFGIKSVSAVVKKYNGLYSNKIENGKFIAFIAL